jgi:DNA-binding CsgD family transcriptional regulator
MPHIVGAAVAIVGHESSSDTLFAKQLVDAGHRVIGVPRSSYQALKCLETEAVDLVVVDLASSPPDTTTEELDIVLLALQLRARWQVPLVYLLPTPTDRTVKHTLQPVFQAEALSGRRTPRLGASAKDSPASREEIVTLLAPRAAATTSATSHDVQRVESLALAAQLLATGDRPSVGGIPLLPLSPRERQVVLRLLGHRSLSHVANDLKISIHTARNHLKRIYQKLGVHSHEELVDYLTTVAVDHSRPALKVSA